MHSMKKQKRDTFEPGLVMTSFQIIVDDVFAPRGDFYQLFDIIRVDVLLFCHHEAIATIVYFPRHVSIVVLLCLPQPRCDL